MSRKRSPTFAPRFSGRFGQQNLLSAICGQQVVGGDRALARRLIAEGHLHEFSSGRTFAKQGDGDNDVYLIVAGSVGVTINGREIAVRSAGTHVGEMALIDPTARRSATLRTLEDTFLLILPETAITRIGEKFPQLWRRFAVELGRRLRERSRFLKEPNSIPAVFVGSSSEALSHAEHISRYLVRKNFDCKLWTDGVFQLSETTIESLVSTAKECDFAVLCLTPDDLTTSRGRLKNSPRDNVVFELGLFMGALGRERVYIVSPKEELKLPTDLLGLTRAVYQAGPKKTLSNRLRPVCRELVRRMTSFGAR